MVTTTPSKSNTASVARSQRLARLHPYRATLSPKTQTTVRMLVLLLLMLMQLRCATALSLSPDHNNNRHWEKNQHPTHPTTTTVPSQSQLHRRDFLLQQLLVGTSAVTAASWSTVPAAFAEETEKSTTSDGFEVFQTPSGLRYIDLKPGNPSSSSPQYGQLVSIAYKSYLTLPGGKKGPQQFDAVDAYLLKHGNGRTISGLDEGLHTMKVGGKRRLLIPPKLGYVESGLGPIPQSPWDRYKLNNLLDEMIKVKGGTIVMEVTLLSTMDDEADQGYYSDASLTPEQFETLKFNLQQKAAAANAASNKNADGE